MAIVVPPVSAKRCRTPRDGAPRCFRRRSVETTNHVWPIRATVPSPPSADQWERFRMSVNAGHKRDIRQFRMPSGQPVQWLPGLPGRPSSWVLESLGHVCCDGMGGVVDDNPARF